MRAVSTSIAQLLQHARRMRAPQSTTSHLDIELLLAMVLNTSRTHVLAHPQQPLSPQQKNQFDQLWQRRLGGEPLAYILGYQEFWSLEFRVNQHTLIPRPETELLVETALMLGDRLKTDSFSFSAFDVLDLGTGCGCIAIALAHQRPHWLIHASDAQSNALALAQQNAQHHRVSLTWHHADWLSNMAEQRYSMIVSNPPYVSPDAKELDDLRYEPRSALVAEQQGMQALLQIIATASAFLHPCGWLLLEHGATQAAAVRKAMHQQGFTAITSCRDLCGRQRVSYGQASTIR